MKTSSLPPSPRGHAFWLFGLSGAGKTTLADLLVAALRRDGTPVLALDGDTLRAGLCAGLGFAEAGRTENLRRAAEVARLAVDSGLVVVASFITPLEAHRRLITGIIGAEALSLIFLQAPLDLCQHRDVKGLYRQARNGQVGQMTGLTSPFEAPTRADLVLDTANRTPEHCLAELLACVRDRTGR
ncbi:MAG: adenylyl-sulfate kinase [Opitutaceae bacterium]|nr:adenylyl-sulfate kinase [Opitutaceae bacterium]